MSTNLTVSMSDEPGAMAGMAEALGKAGVNIEGGCGVTGGSKGVVNVLVEDAGAARKALEAAGYAVEKEQDVLVFDIEDRPGTLGKLGRRIADAGVNLNLMYLATGTRLVLGAENLDKARAALG